MTYAGDVALPDVGRFSEDPCRSHTLPGSYYYAPGVFELEKRAIFNRTWQYVCHLSRVAEPGRYCVRDIGDQSVVVLRDRGGELRAFHNVCQHRAHRLVEGTGRLGAAIVCPYHNWSYELSGELRLARHSEEVADFDRGAIRLSRVRAETFCGFVFVNLDPDARPIMEGREGLDREIRELSPAIEDLKLAYEREIPIAANWKNSVENYSECYHCPNRHPVLMQGSLDLDSYRITVHPEYHSHSSRGVGESTVYARSMDTDGDEREFGSWLLWPNFALEVYPGGYLNVFHHEPAAPERTVQRVEWYFPTEEPTPEQREVIEFVDVVRDEDVPICESVQRGLHSLGYTQGRLIATADRPHFSEHAVHDFQAKVLKALRAHSRVS
ncbi:MAG: aromatic ring-hydroxylating dioxygenase subunit alpha [Chromatiales bacterium]|nr:aromatic ring-hydroxylating dioxygenase subunit alpha [Chromatiales bacterium]